MDCQTPDFNLPEIARSSNYKTVSLSLKFASAKKKSVVEEFFKEYQFQKARAKRDFLKMKKVPRADRIPAEIARKYQNILGLNSTQARSVASQAISESKSARWKEETGTAWLFGSNFEIVENANKKSKYSHFFIIKAFGVYGRKGSRKSRKFAIPIKLHKQFKKMANNPDWTMSEMCRLTPTDIRFVFTQQEYLLPKEATIPVAVDFDKYGQIHTSNNKVFAEKSHLYRTRIKKALAEKNARKAATAKLEYDKYFKSQFRKMLSIETPSKVIIGNFIQNTTYSCGLKALDLCELYCVPSKVIHSAHRSMICVHCGCKNNNNGSFFLAFFCERCNTQQAKAQTGCQNLFEEYTKRQNGSRRDKCAEYVANKKAFELNDEVPHLTEEMMRDLYPEYEKQRKWNSLRRFQAGIKTETIEQQYQREWMND